MARALLERRAMPRFLIVDDDHPTVTGMTRLLVDDGHEVAAFTSGRDALEALDRTVFDAIVTDLEMPGVDGHRVVDATRLRQPHACLVVVTVSVHEHLERLVRAGACIVADKPVDYAELTRHVTECRLRGGPGLGGRCHLRSGRGDPIVKMK